MIIGKEQYAVAMRACYVLVMSYSFGYGNVDGCIGYSYGNSNGNEDRCGTAEGTTTRILRTRTEARMSRVMATPTTSAKP